MEEKIAIEWLRRVFIPQTAPSDPNEWRLLVIDGHHTHTTIDFMWKCFSNKIYIVFLPAHSSHILQPLDVQSSSRETSRPLPEKERIMGRPRSLTENMWLALQNLVKFTERVWSAGDALVFTNRAEETTESIKASPNRMVFNNL